MGIVYLTKHQQTKRIQKCIYCRFPKKECETCDKRWLDKRIRNSHYARKHRGQYKFVPRVVRRPKGGSIGQVQTVSDRSGSSSTGGSGKRDMWEKLTQKDQNPINHICSIISEHVGDVICDFSAQQKPAVDKPTVLSEPTSSGVC